MDTVLGLALLLAAGLVAADVRRHGRLGIGPVQLGPLGWFIAVLPLWPIAVPLYVFLRHRRDAQLARSSYPDAAERRPGATRDVPARSKRQRPSAQPGTVAAWAVRQYQRRARSTELKMVVLEATKAGQHPSQTLIQFHKSQWPTVANEAAEQFGPRQAEPLYRDHETQLRALAEAAKILFPGTPPGLVLAPLFLPSLFEEAGTSQPQQPSRSSGPPRSTEPPLLEAPCEVIPMMRDGEPRGRGVLHAHPDVLRAYIPAGRVTLRWEHIEHSFHTDVPSSSQLERPQTLALRMDPLDGGLMVTVEAADEGPWLELLRSHWVPAREDGSPG